MQINSQGMGAMLRAGRATGRIRSQHILSVGVRHLFLIVLLIIMLYPLIWMLGASFEPSMEIFSNPGLLPRTWTLANYKTGWFPLQDLSFTRLFANSIIIASLAAAGNVCSCTMAAYAFARLQFRFRSILFA